MFQARYEVSECSANAKGTSITDGKEDTQFVPVAKRVLNLERQ